MTADLQAIRDDRPVSIAIRRNNSTLAVQTVRIARGGNVQAGVTDTEGLQAAVGAVIVVGDPTSTSNRATGSPSPGRCTR